MTFVDSLGILVIVLGILRYFFFCSVNVGYFTDIPVYVAEEDYHESIIPLNITLKEKHKKKYF